MKWQFNNESPIYSQLVEKIKISIVTGEFKSGEKLPAVRELATQAGVNPNTMQRAFAQLEREGLVYSQRTSGRLVTEDSAMIRDAKFALAQKHLESFISGMKVLGFGEEDIIKLLKERRDENE